MRRLFPALLLCCALLPASWANSVNELEQGFANPPPQTKPWCYWYWISGNISKVGITRDLEAMARVGIGEALIGNIHLDEVASGPVKVLSEEWWQLLEHAIREGGRVGVNIGLFNCPGWSQSGGPWIKPEQTMRYLTSAETRVSGPLQFSQRLPSPKNQFQDVAVLAFPPPKQDSDVLSTKSLHISSTPAGEDVGTLVDGNPNSKFIFPSGESLLIEMALDQPLSARAVEIIPADYPFRADVELQAERADGTFASVRKFDCDWTYQATAVGFIAQAPLTISFPAVTASRFRLLFSIITPGHRNFVPSTGAALAEINLTGAARLDLFIEKQLGKMHPTPLPLGDTYQWPPAAEPDDAELIIPANQVLNLSKHLAADGTLNWNVPPGDWVILRTGMTPTGMSNSPAAPQARGYEVDKMNRKLAQHHFDSFVGQLLNRMPASERKAFSRVVADSYEMGAQNWTDDFDRPFQKRYGYDPKPWLPVLTGRIVDSAESSDRFLWDLRRLVADRVATEYVGGLRDACRTHGLKLWLENYGHWGFPSEFLLYGREADGIGGEFWVTGDLGSIECRAASSCANIYGKRIVSAESFTGGPPFRNSPRDLKARGDWSFCEGINHVVLHVYIHQPWEDKLPGVNAPWGTEFNRHNTWFERSKTWMDYERRCCWLLQQGWRVADVAYYIGEDAPKMTGTQKPALPAGFDFDYINADVIENKLSVRDGLLTLPHGTSYRLLVLPEQGKMRPEVLRKIRDLVKRGATVVGPPPDRSPSLEDFPAGDKKVRQFATELWDGLTSGHGSFGKGQVFTDQKLEDVFERLGIQPDFDSDIPLRFTHRREGNTDIYFVANPHAKPVATVAAFRVSGRAPELWRPETGRIERPAVCRIADGRVTLPLDFAPHGSLFVVFRDSALTASEQIISVKKDGKELLGTTLTGNSTLNKHPTPLQLRRTSAGLTAHAAQAGEYELLFADGSSHKFAISELPESLSLGGPWEVSFTSGWGAPERIMLNSLSSWSEQSDQGIKFYSGTAVYRKAFTLPDSVLHQPGARVTLNLDEVHDLATVRMNGHDLGTLWLPPWQLDVTDALKAGENNLEIEVISSWNNRLVGDAALPEDQRRTFLTLQTIGKDAPLLPAGLLGQVTLQCTKEAHIK